MEGPGGLDGAGFQCCIRHSKVNRFDTRRGIHRIQRSGTIKVVSLNLYLIKIYKFSFEDDDFVIGEPLTKEELASIITAKAGGIL